MRTYTKGQCIVLRYTMIDVGVYALFYRSGLAFSRYFERGGDGMVVRGPVGAEESGFISD